MSSRSRERVSQDTGVENNERSFEISRNEAVLGIPKKQFWIEKLSHKTTAAFETLENVTQVLADIETALRVEPIIEQLDETASAEEFRVYAAKIKGSFETTLAAQTTFLGAAKEIVAGLDAFTVESEADIEELSQKISKVGSLLKTITENNQKLKKLGQIDATVRDTYQAAALKELGIENANEAVQKISEFGDRQGDLSYKGAKLTSWRNGFGLLNREEVKRNTAEQEEVREKYENLHRVLYSSKVGDRLPYFSDWDFAKGVEHTKNKLSSVVFSVLTKQYESSLESAKNKHFEEPKEVSDAQLKSIAMDYVRHQYKEEEWDEDEGAPSFQEIEKGVAAITDYYISQNAEAFNDAAQGFKQCHQRFLSRLSREHKISSYNNIATFLGTVPRQREEHVAMSDFRNFLKKAEDEFARQNVYESRDLEYRARQKQTSLDYLENSANNMREKSFLHAYESKDWSFFKSNKEIQELFNEEDFTEAEQYIAQLALENFMDKHARGTSGYTFEGILKALKKPESIPLIALRSSGEGSTIHAEGTLFTYLKSFAPAETELLEQQIPGLSELMLSARGDQVDSEKMQNGLKDLLVYFLQSPETGVRLFAGDMLSRFGRSQEYETWAEICTVLPRFFELTPGEKDQEKVMDVVVKRASRDRFNGLGLLPKNEEHLNPNVRLKTAEAFVGIVAKHPDDPEADVAYLAKTLEVSLEDMQKTLELVKTVDRADSRIHYEGKDFRKYLELAKTPGIIDALSELALIGYEFSIGHTKELPGIIRRKDELIQEVKNIRKFVPVFRYAPAEEGAVLLVEPRALLSRYGVDNYIGDPETFADTTQLFFDAYLEYNPAQIVKYKERYFVEQVRLLPQSEINRIVDAHLSSSQAPDPHLFRNFALEDRQKEGLVNKLLINQNYEELVELLFPAYGFNRAAIIQKIIHKNADAFLKAPAIERLSLVEFSPELNTTFQNHLFQTKPSEFLAYEEVFKKMIPEGATFSTEWGAMYSRLENLQGRAGREEYDPWKTDLDPLLTKNWTKLELDTSKQVDAEIVYNFVNEYGMYNLPTIFEWHVALSRTKEMSEIPENVREEMEATLGVSLDRFTNKGALTQEIKKFKTKIQKDLLADKIPEAVIHTKAGLDLFNSLKGSTRFSQDGTPPDILKKWKEMVSDKPELAKMKEGYKEVSFEVPLIKKKKLELKEEEAIREAETKILANPDLNTVIFGYEAAYRDAHHMLLDTTSIPEWWQTHMEKNMRFMEQELAALDAILDRTDEQWDALIAAQSNEKEKMALEKKRKALKTPVGKTGFNKQKEKLLIENTKVDQLILPPGFEDLTMPGHEAVVAEFLEKVNTEFSGRIPEKDELMRTLSALHAFLVMSPAQKDMLSGRLVERPSAYLNKEEVYSWASYMRDYMKEHYLNAEQKVEHTKHSAFSKELLAGLHDVWNTKDVKNNILFKQEAELKKLEKADQEETGETTTVHLVPSRGVLRTYGGDLGDACYSSRHGELAEGKYPELTSFTFVTGRNTKNERLAGSVLAIEATTPEGEKVLLVRANNPQESLLHKVDPDVLIAKTLEEMKALAARREIPLVVVPLDGASTSSSNRPLVSAYYAKKFKRTDVVRLVKTPETQFNGYPNWDPTGSNRVVKI